MAAPIFFKKYNSGSWSWIRIGDHTNNLAVNAGDNFETEEDCDQSIANVRDALARIEVVRDPSAPMGTP